MAGMNGWIIALLVSGFAALIVWLGVVQARKTRENLRVLTEKLGLKLDTAEPALGIFPRAPRAQGVIDGRIMELYTFTRGSGKSQTHWCALRTRPQSAGAVEFDLSPQGLGSRVLGWFGVKEITVGHRAFDEAFFVRTNQPDLFGAALVPDIQARLLAAQQAGVRGTFKLEQGALTYTEQGSFSSEALCAHFAPAAELLRDLADAAEACARVG